MISTFVSYLHSRYYISILIQSKNKEALVMLRSIANRLLPRLPSRLTSSISVEFKNEVPPRLSAFTGKPDFYEALFFLDDILLNLKPFDKSLSTTAGQSIQWHDRQALSDSFGFSLSMLQHRKIKDKLSMLACYSSIPEIRLFLSNFTNDTAVMTDKSSKVQRDEKVIEATRIFGRIDSLGRAVAKGKRKAATAKVYLVEGEGLFYVNGKPAAEYFNRMVDMFKLAEPFRVTSTFGKYNVWALVRGGGHTGKFPKMEM